MRSAVVKVAQPSIPVCLIDTSHRLNFIAVFTIPQTPPKVFGFVYAGMRHEAWGLAFVLRGSGTLDLSVDVGFVPFEGFLRTALTFAAGAFRNGDFKEDVGCWGVV